ncbi:Amino acid transporter, transmembrane [Corchorus capsularis]|uniref:Amino acid transporter, transmembrane n=1 Tax=Corchorus capsularis TaxID=210143 RepID=A0A1R3G1S9_COCAP|nr:Amino acid transporter, transmembrane [Corchorus capsularis]
MGENGAAKNQIFDLSIDVLPQGGSKCFDDDGRLKRTGTVWTASAHIITAVIGSGVLSLAWATAQLGWIAGPTVMFLFSFVTYYTSTLLAACYRSGDPVNGKRNYTYMDAVRSNLGGFKVKICGWVQYLNLMKNLDSLLHAIRINLDNLGFWS